MQVDEEEKSSETLAGSPTTTKDRENTSDGPPPIGIHPLVLINLSDHHIRSSSSSSNAITSPILGVLYGTRSSNNYRQSISLMDSFEVVWNTETNSLNIPYIQARHEQCRCTELTLFLKFLCHHSCSSISSI